MIILVLYACLNTQPPPSSPPPPPAKVPVEAVVTSVVRVVVARRDLYPGLEIEMEDLSTVAVSNELLEYAPAASMFRAAVDVEGRVPRDVIKVGEIVRSEHLSKQGTGPGIDAMLLFGQRAVPVRMSAPHKALGLSAEDFVDVYWRREERGCGAAELALQGLEVLKVEEADGERWMSLRMSGDEAVAFAAIPAGEELVVQRAGWDIGVYEKAFSWKCRR